MAQLIHNCPRCGAKQITFDTVATGKVEVLPGLRGIGEVFCICRACKGSTVFICTIAIPGGTPVFGSLFGESNKSVVNDLVEISGFISIRDFASVQPPEHVPKELAEIFKEGSVCESVRCYNAAGTMYRLCVDKVSEALLPEQDGEGLNSKIRRSLGLRLEWLFQAGRLDQSLKELSHCIKEDGNDGAHKGVLSAIDAEDLRDFTSLLLERIYTVPARLRRAEERRVERRTDAK